ncbi:hypothetical protein [Acidithiobacillus thiooxidans]|uniref:hypothetical protein n=1 Tax=Acidithiobacillus thiooxidans TaxID=930 RepID=UPI001112A560|nr:hypothetical protein [Acidithiobacillus thiooxidans]
MLLPEIVYPVDEPRFSQDIWSRYPRSSTALWTTRYRVTTSRYSFRLADHNPDGRRGSSWTPLRCLGFGLWIAGITLQKIVYPVDENAKKSV